MLGALIFQRPVVLVQHGKVHATIAKQGLNNGQVGLITVSRELHAVLEPRVKVAQEKVGVLVGALADQPRGGQFGVGVNRRPGPHVAVARGALELLGYVLLLDVAEGPSLVALNPGGVEVAECGVLVVSARLPNVGQELDDGVLGRPLVSFFLFGYIGSLNRAGKPRMERLRGVQRGAVIALVVALALTIILHQVA